MRRLDSNGPGAQPGAHAYGERALSYLGFPREPGPATSGPDTRGAKEPTSRSDGGRQRGGSSQGDEGGGPTAPEKWRNRL